MIELLVVMAIIGILTGGAITAYNNFNKGQTVRRAALDLVTDIRETQNRAVSGLKDVECRVDLDSDRIEDYKLDGHYLIFKEGFTDDFYHRQQSCSEDIDSGQSAVPPQKEIPPDPGEIINLIGNGSVKVDTVNLMPGGGCGLPSGTLTVNFLPLRGVEFYDGAGLGGSQAASICLIAEIVISDGTSDFLITVDLSGQVTQSRP